jgi:hypothetical protein
MSPLSRRDWAWEFLRRNPAFKAAVAQLETVIASRNLGANVTLYALPDRESPLAEWGVIFRVGNDSRGSRFLGSGVVSGGHSGGRRTHAAVRGRRAIPAQTCDPDGHFPRGERAGTRPAEPGRGKGPARGFRRQSPRRTLPVDRARHP